MDSAMDIVREFNYCTEESRLKSFKKWPFKNDSTCTAVEMARAGFYCPDDKFADLAKCFVCYKELDGWEVNDDPWKEHKSHSPECPFIKSGKTQAEMTVQDFLALKCEQTIFLLKKHHFEPKKEALLKKHEDVVETIEKLL